MKAVFVDDERCLSCHSCELACCVQHSQSKTLFKAIGEECPPRTRIHVEPLGQGAFPLQCRNCEDPRCVKACVAKALYLDSASGV
ncbi:MAG: hypothetical protein LBD25_08005, partial [Coriobacteriales bacterium]|nr:hypothetical protein [Coriobacteriales bacterium]